MATYRSVPERIFGDSSRLADGRAVYDTFGSDPSGSLAGSPVFQLLMLVCFAGYCLTIFYYRSQAAALFGLFRGPSRTEKLLDEKSRVFDAFVSSSIVLSLLSLALAAARYADMRYGTGLSEWGIPAWAVHAFPAALWAAAIMVFGLQFVLLWVAGWLTRSQQFTSKLFYMKKMVTAMAALFVIPVLLLLAINAHLPPQVFLYVISVCVTGVFVLLLAETYFLFVREKVSVLLWFLYLCAVEILPVATIAILAVRNV